MGGSACSRISNYTTYNTYFKQSQFKDYKKAPRKITYDLLYCYTNKFIDYLKQKGYISNALFTIESGKSGNLHVNIALEVNPRISDVENLLNRSWLLGNSISEPVDNLHKLIMYMTKELDIFSNKESDRKKIDYWNFHIKLSEIPSPASEMEKAKLRIKPLIRIFTPQLRCIKGGNPIMVNHKIRYLRVA